MELVDTETGNGVCVLRNRVKGMPFCASMAITQHGRVIGSGIKIGPLVFGKYKDASMAERATSIWDYRHPDYHVNMSRHTAQVIQHMIASGELRPGGH